MLFSMKSNSQKSTNAIEDDSLIYTRKANLRMIFMLRGFVHPINEIFINYNEQSLFS